MEVVCKAFLSCRLHARLWWANLVSWCCSEQVRHKLVRTWIWISLQIPVAQKESCRKGIELGSLVKLYCEQAYPSIVNLASRGGVTRTAYRIHPTGSWFRAIRMDRSSVWHHCPSFQLWVGSSFHPKPEIGWFLTKSRCDWQVFVRQQAHRSCLDQTVLWKTIRF